MSDRDERPGHTLPRDTSRPATGTHSYRTATGTHTRFLQLKLHLGRWMKYPYSIKAIAAKACVPWISMDFSTVLTLLAATRTSTWPGITTGLGSSLAANTSGPPKPWITIAFRYRYLGGVSQLTIAGSQGSSLYRLFCRAFRHDAILG